ncbi:MAG TPA: transglutaminase-like domain-containing protein, partial [Ktedonobacterales bacterium]|nr:transglutaminase-like domain-containing protein [Ktedonobacterales bacterium]
NAPDKALTLTATIKLYHLPATENGSFLFGFDQALGFSVPARAPTTSAGDPTALTVADWQATQQLKQGTTYSMTSAIITPTTPANGSLPSDLASRLAQVPSSLADVVHSLAVQWAGSAKSPVDQANALLDAMEKNLHYDPQAAPPKGQDGITWFLANKKGNLLLWTTTFIMLGRSLGLPLRLAEGYQSGDYDDQLHAQVARASDASVWAQLAIPGAGWLDLYPAANIQTIITPGKIIYATPPPIPTIRPSPQPAPDTHHGNSTPNNGQTAGQNKGILVISLGLVLGLLALIVAALAVISWRWARFGQHLAPLARFFARIGLLARWGGVTLRPSDTATQATGKVGAYLPRQQETLVTLNRAYERLTYGPPESRNILIDLREKWDQLRRDLWNLVVRRFLGRK